MQPFHNFELRATSNFESSFSYKTAVMSIKTLGIFILLAYCIFPPSPAPLVRETYSNSIEPPAKLSGFFPTQRPLTHTGDSILAVPAPELWETIFSFHWPACGVVLKQHKWTKLVGVQVDIQGRPPENENPEGWGKMSTCSTVTAKTHLWEEDTGGGSPGLLWMMLALEPISRDFIQSQCSTSGHHQCMNLDVKFPCHLRRGSQIPALKRTNLLMVFTYWMDIFTRCINSW